MFYNGDLLGYLYTSHRYYLVLLLILDLQYLVKSVYTKAILKITPPAKILYKCYIIDSRALKNI
jgi:hypothetical protein